VASAAFGDKRKTLDDCGEMGISHLALSRHYSGRSILMFNDQFLGRPSMHWTQQIAAAPQIVS